MCLLSTKSMEQLSGPIVLRFKHILKRQSLFYSKQQLKDLKKDEFTLYMDVRSACIHYIRSFCSYFRTKPDTFAATVNILDVFLWKVKVTERHMSIVSAACFLIAAKMLESEQVCPSAKQLARFHEWTAKDLCRMEVHILRKMDWCVTSVSYLEFLPVLAPVFGVGVRLLFCDAIIALAERCLSRQSTVLMRPGVLALSLLHHVIADELPSLIESQVLVHCNIQESELNQCKKILDDLSPLHNTSLTSAFKFKFPLKVFEKPSEMGVTCLPTIIEESTA